MALRTTKTKTGIRFPVRVQPRSSRREIKGVEGGAIKVMLTAPPAEGQANAQLVEVLSKALGVPKSRVAIIRGQASRNKTVEVTGLNELPPDLEKADKGA